MMVPWKAVFVPSVAELPTTQKTLPADAPLINVTVELLAVVSVLPIWKIKRALGFPWPSKTRAVFNWAEEEKQYTPGPRVLSKLGATVVQGRPTRSSKAACKSSFAWAVAASLMCRVPVKVPGGNPVTEVPGVNPMSPFTTLGPVLVIVLAAKTEKPAAPLRRADPAPGCPSPLFSHDGPEPDPPSKAAPEAASDVGPVTLCPEPELQP